MAEREGQLVVNLETSHPDTVVDLGKIVLGEKARKKTSQKQKVQAENLSKAACALLNSGGGIIRMESEDKNYSFQQHGLGLDLEQSLRGCLSCSETDQYFTWRQRQAHVLLFVKTWSCGDPEQKSAAPKPRICSLSTGLSQRSFSSVVSMTPSDAADFLRRKESLAKHPDEDGPRAKKALLNFSGGAEETSQAIEEATTRFLKRDKLMAGEVLNFTETTHTEFKNFSTNCILKYVNKSLPKYVSAFGNTKGGYLFYGVHDNGTVIGTHQGVEKEALEQALADTIGSMAVHHFCGSRAGVQFQTYIQSVYDAAGTWQGYVCTVRVEPSCCPVFHGDPESWKVSNGRIERLSLREWVELMTAADPVGSDGIKWKPETVCADLFSEYPGLEDLMKKEIHPLSKGVLIFSRSWAVEIGLGKKRDVVCDVLLVAENTHPVLYTVVGDTSPAEAENLRETAYALKQRLVNDGGYASKVCVIPQILHLNGTEEQMEVAGDDILQQEAQENLCNHTSLYPEDYVLTSRDVPAFLRALVIVVLSFKSYLSDHLGCEVFNLLTLKQYELLSKNLHKAREQFVIGLPGTGKTIVALKIIERIRNVFHCSAKEILYICENQPLKNFVGNKICQSVTRVTFLNGIFPEVKHIVVDEAQNFRSEQDWYRRAQELVKKKKGIFWVFMDFFQTTHPYDCGLNFSELYPQEWLTKMVRNAKEICSVMFDLMEKILKERKTHVPYEVLGELLKEATCAHSLPGDYIEKQQMETYEMVKYVITNCHSYLRQGYRLKDIAILCSTEPAASTFRWSLATELERQKRKSNVRLVLGSAEGVSRNCIVLDSIRRFSGLERRIVFCIHPVPAQEEVSCNLLLCAASRAHSKLHVLYHREEMFLRDMSFNDTLLSPMDTGMFGS
ncbi:schlafen family member 9-like isoform X2 [Apus apus]|uniref:schlafen family member 9-like isoform X2 n=1 Tax=Apus apus TaxID=8895 RepID=UPI0021F89B6B|nr:schlafen family member 9-like isoform X2 [Apus apus]